MKIIKWPAQSPDLNSIEHLWNHLKWQLSGYETLPSRIIELWERVGKEWADIDPAVCQNLVESMPKRVAAILKARKSYTKY